jgi:hypothetical protein
LSPNDWVLFTYDPQAPSVIIPMTEGRGGLEEVRGILTADMICWIFMRCDIGVSRDSVGSDYTTERSVGFKVKHLFISWVGENISPLKRGQTTNHKLEIRKVIQRVSVDIDANNLKDISTDTVVRRLNASGAEFVPQSFEYGSQAPPPSVALTPSKSVHGDLEAAAHATTTTSESISYLKSTIAELRQQCILSLIFSLSFSLTLTLSLTLRCCSWP